MVSEGLDLILFAVQCHRSVGSVPFFTELDLLLVTAGLDLILVTAAFDLFLVTCTAGLELFLDTEGLDLFLVTAGLDLLLEAQYQICSWLQQVWVCSC
jgi:hypothetical protein